MASKNNAMSYIKNVGKSLGYATIDVMKEYNPILSSLGKEAKDTASNVYQSVKSFSLNGASDSEKSLLGQGKDIVGDLFKNLKDDLKSGNWYNKQRQSEANDAMMKAMGFDFGDFDIDFDDWGDDLTTGESTQISQDVKNTQATILALDSTGAKIAGAVNEATVASADYVVRSNRQMNKALYDLNRRGFNQVTEALMSVNKTTAGFAEAIGKPLTTHINNSQTFFIKTTETLNNMEKSLEKIVKNTTPAPASNNRYKRAEGMSDFVSSNGSISIDLYKEMIKENFKDYKELANMILGEAKNTGGLRNIAKTASPMSWITQGLIKSIIPKAIKESMKDLNTGISDLISGAIVKGQHSNSMNPFVTILKEIFLPKDELKTKLNPSNYNQGAVAWDGVARKALIEVIPTTLFKIYSAITGSEEARYDYKSGKFVSRSTIAKDRNSREMQYAQRAGGDLYRDASRNASKSEQDMIDAFFLESFRNGDPSTVFKNTKNLDSKTKAKIKKMLSSGKYNSIFRETSSARLDYTNMMKNLEASGDSLDVHLDNNNDIMGSTNLKGFIGGSYHESVLTYLKGIYENTMGKGNKSKSKGERTRSEANKNRQSIKVNESIAGKTNEDIQEEDELTKATKEAADEISNTQEKAKSWIRTKLDKILPKGMVDAFEKPINAITKFIGVLTSGVSEFLWGEKGIFIDIKNKFKEKMKNFWDDTKKTLGDVGRKIFGFGEPFIEDNPDGSFAYGTRQVGRTGLYVLSEGEMIIPSEFNPFFHGVTNKSSQIAREQAVIDSYTGSRVRSRSRRIRRAVKGTKAAKADDSAAGGADDPVSGEDAKKVFSIIDLFDRIVNWSKGTGNKVKEKASSSNIGSKISDAFKKAGIKEAQGGIGAGGIIGGVAGTFVGSPILGAIVGSTIGYVAKSQKAQDFLFGAQDENGDKTGGFFSKEFSNFATKQLPNTARGAAIGGIGGLFLGSPILGAIAGSAISYVSSSESAKKFLFGEKDENGERQGGVVPKKAQDFIKKSVPKAIIGSAIGALAGPFGIAGNLIMGAGVGMFTETERFKTFFFGGKKKNGKEVEGLFPKIQKKILGNITELFANMGNRLKGIGKHILNSLKNGISNIGKKISDKIEKSKERGGFVGRLATGVSTVAGGLAKLPVNLAGGVLGHMSKSLKRRNLRQGYDVYDKRLGRNLLAQERVDLRGELGGFSGEDKKFDNFDQLLASIETKEQYNQLMNSLDKVGDGSESSKQILKQWSKTLGGEIDTKTLLKMKEAAKNEGKSDRFKDPVTAATQNIELGIISLVKKVCGIDLKPSSPSIIPHRIIKKDNKEEDEESDITTQFDMFANPHRYIKDDNGELKEVDNDAETDQSRKKMDSFAAGITGLPTLFGGLANKIGGFFGNIKDKKDKSEKSGIIDTIKNFISGGFSKEGLVSLLSKAGPLLGSVAGLLGFGLLISGKFDNLASKITGGSYGSKTAQNIVTTASGATAQLDENGIARYTKDAEDGSYKAGDIVTEKISVKKGDADSLSTKGKKTAGRYATSIVTKASSSIGKGITKIAAAGADEAAVVAAKTTMSSGLGSAFKKVPMLKKLLGTDRLDNMAATLSEKIAAKAGASGMKAIGNALSTAALVVKIAMAVTDFTTGYEDARTTLGIVEEPTIGQRLVSGTIRLVKNLIPIGSLIPDSLIVDVAVDFIFPALGLDVAEFKAQRERSQDTVDTYNQNNGTDLTIEQFNKQVLNDYTWTERIGNAAKSTVADTKTKISNFTSSVKENGFGNTIKNMGAEAINTFKDSYSKNGGGISGILSGIGDNFGNMLPGVFGEIAQKNMQIKSLALQGKIKDMWGVGLDDFSGGGEQVEGTELTTAVPSIFSKIIGQLPLIMSKLTMTPVSITAMAGRKIGEFVSGIVDKVKGNVSAISQSFSTGTELLAKGDISFSEFMDTSSITEDEENPVGGITSAICKISRFVSLPFMILKKIGNKIKSAISPAIDAVKAGFNNVLDITISAKEKSNAGDITGLWNLESQDDENNPLGGAYKVINFGSKLMYTIPTLIHMVGNKIKDAFGSYIDGVKANQQTYSTSIEAINAIVDSDDGKISNIWNVQDITSKGNLSGLFNFAIGVSKITGTFKLIFNKIVGKLTNIIDKVKNIGNSVANWVDDKVDTAKDKVKGVAQNGWNKLTGWISGGSSGFVSQYDPRYAGYNIGNNTFAAKGCGPAVASMAASAAGKNLSVSNAVSASKSYQNYNGVSGDYFSNVLGSKGIKTKYLTTPQQIASQIIGGGSTILLGSDPYNTSKSRSPFGPNNHYVLATGVDKQGNIIINDPENNGPRAYSPAILNSASLGIYAGGASNAMDSDKSKQIWSYLKSKGLSDSAVAGMMGNFWTESKFDTTNHSGDGGKAAGIAQWHNYKNASGRWAGLKAYADQNGKDWTDLETQLGYALSEMTGSHKKSFGYNWEKYGYTGLKGKGLEDFLQTNDTEYAAKLFAAAFERPTYSEKGIRSRIDNANTFMSLYGGTTATGTSTSSADSASTSNSDSTEKLSFFNILSRITSAFSNAFTKKSNDATSSTTDGGNQTYLDLSNTNANEKQKALAQKMASIQGKLRYSLKSGEQNPDNGAASCASTVGWAYKKTLGVDNMSASSTAQSKDTRFTTIYTNDGKNLVDYNKLMPGDIIYNNWDQTANNGKMQHTEMYVGDGKDLSHGGADKSNPTGYGPVYKNLNKYRLQHTMMVRRYNEFMNSGSGSGLVPHQFIGGDSGLETVKSKTSSMLSGLASNIKSSASSGQMSTDLMQQLITAIITILQAIADNTAPVEKIYEALSGLSSNSSKSSNTTANTATISSSSSDDIDSNFKSVVSQLAAIAKG